MTNKRVKTAMAETRVTLEQLGEAYGVTKQRMSVILQDELPEEKQTEYCDKVLSIAKDRIRRVEMTT